MITNQPHVDRCIATAAVRSTILLDEVIVIHVYPKVLTLLPLSCYCYALDVGREIDADHEADGENETRGHRSAAG